MSTVNETKTETTTVAAPEKAVKKSAPEKTAAKKAAPKKATKKPAKATRYCLGKCSCGSPCCLDRGHSGAHKCAFHA